MYIHYYSHFLSKLLMRQLIVMLSPTLFIFPFPSLYSLLPCIQLWDDKDAKQKLSKVNARVCIVSLCIFFHHTLTALKLFLCIRFFSWRCVCTCHYSMYRYTCTCCMQHSSHFPTHFCLYIVAVLFLPHFSPSLYMFAGSWNSEAEGTKVQQRL